MRLQYGCLFQLSSKEAIELGIWVSDYPEADHLHIDFEKREVELFDEQGTCHARRGFDYFK